MLFLNVIICLKDTLMLTQSFPLKKLLTVFMLTLRVKQKVPKGDVFSIEYFAIWTIQMTDI